MWTAIQCKVGAKVDGKVGPNTRLKIAEYLDLSDDWKEIQKFCGANPDGEPGRKTAEAVSRKLGVPGPWPRESECASFYGSNPSSKVIALDLPYPMRLAWDKGTTVHKMACHELVAPSLKRIFQRTLDHYGFDRIRALGLDLFGGCYNDRNKVGGSTKSMHAYACAVDLDPDRNQLKWGKEKAVFALPEYDAFWRFVEEEGGYSLGRRKNYDWMHFQFAWL